MGPVGLMKSTRKQKLFAIIGFFLEWWWWGWCWDSDEGDEDVGKDGIKDGGNDGNQDGKKGKILPTL